MPPQKIVTTSKRGRGAARPRKSKGANRSKPALRAKPNSNQADSHNQHDATPAQFINHGQDEKTEAEVEREVDNLPIAESVGGARRSTRAPKKRHDDDHVFGSELEHHVNLISVRKADDREDGNFQAMSSSPPTLLTFKQQSQIVRRKPSRSSKNVPFSFSLDRIDEGDSIPTSDTVQASQNYPESRHSLFNFQPDETVYQIMNSLCGKSKISIDLPTLTLGNPEGRNVEAPYTSTFLTHLYIVAYNAAQFNLCDLVADTWIRAFHALRRHHEKNNKEDQFWRPNDALLRRRAQGKKGFDDAAPKWGHKLHVEDPALDANVVEFSSTLLHQLYDATKPNCGARLLWADAMALCGSKLEPRIQSRKKRGETWHPELVHDILCTTLRMARRKLTLKIEEGTEGAWCKRYHEHYRLGLPCYRRLAYERKVRGEETSDEDESDDEMAQVVEAELGAGEKRTLEGVEGGEVEMGDAKRVRLEDREVTDEDAEGEPDDE